MAPGMMFEPFKSLELMVYCYCCDTYQSPAKGVIF